MLNPDIFSDTHTLFLCKLQLNSQCVGDAKEVRIERVILIMKQIIVKTWLKMPFVFQRNSEFLQFLDLYHKRSKVHQDLAMTLMSKWQIK